MTHFAYSLLDLTVYLFYGAWFVFLVWFIVRLVRVMNAIEDASRSLRVMAYDIREMSDDIKAIKEKMSKEESA